MDFINATWVNPPGKSKITSRRISIVTSPYTDFWQRTYYGFQNDNAHALLLALAENFSFSCRVRFEYRHRYDQCGIVIYQNSDNWFKASVEYENDRFYRLGSVVTNHGYSDWATVDIPATKKIWYRLSRRGPDFLVESSTDGKIYRQMRIFHLHILGDTSVEQCSHDQLAGQEAEIRAGIYACSPEDSSFLASFDCFRYHSCCWKAHS